MGGWRREVGRKKSGRDEERLIWRGRSYLLVYLAQDLPCSFCVEESHHYPCVLAFEVGHGRGRVGQEALSGGDANPGCLGSDFEVVQGLEQEIGNVSCIRNVSLHALIRSDISDIVKKDIMAFYNAHHSIYCYTL